MTITPTAARRLYEDQLPSLMTVFALDTEASAGRNTKGLNGDKSAMMVGEAKRYGNSHHTLPPSPPSFTTTAVAASQSSLADLSASQPPHYCQNQVPGQHFWLEEPNPQRPMHPEARHGPPDLYQPREGHGGTDLQINLIRSPSTVPMCLTDSPPVSSPSPASPAPPSPDKPALVPLNNYPSTSFGDLSPPTLATLSVGSGLIQRFERPMTSPAAPRRPRNMKGLSIQPPFNSSSKTAAFAPGLVSPAFAMPVAAAFEHDSGATASGGGGNTGAKPTLTTAAPVKRKPSLLTLKTNARDLVTRGHELVPPSPGMPPILQRRALKHSTSTPQMLSGLKTCSFGPAGGMGFPKVFERNESGLSELLRPLKSSMKPSLSTTIHEEEARIKPQLASRAQLDQEPYAELENNEDQRSPGYPDGPIAIYEDKVFLYMEPTAEEASGFDLVINVAREVRNPFHPDRDDFEGLEDEHLLPKTTEAASGSSTPGPVPGTAATQMSFMTALEHQKTPMREPEYVHVPWDHHTNIATDLMALCEKIDSWARDGKRVLIHCQQGASRSASLIIAYGMYLNPDLSVNDAYYAAQARSKWISPNMKLMYCLQDFQKEVSKRRTPQATAGFRQRTNRSPSKHKLTLSAEAIPASPHEPRTAPLPSNSAHPGPGSRDPEASSPSSTTPKNSSSGGRRLAITSPNGDAITPGPSSAPSSFSWPGCAPVVRGLGVGRPEFNPESLSRRPTVETVRKPPPALPNSLEPACPHKPKSSTPGDVTAAPWLQSTTSFSQTTVPSFGPPRGGAATLVSEGATALAQALMSPRAERMIRKQFTDRLDSTADMPPRPSASTPPQPLFSSIEELSSGPGLTFSPRNSVAAREPFYPFQRPIQTEDPRSPVALGETHIVRSIDEQLV